MKFNSKVLFITALVLCCLIAIIIVNSKKDNETSDFEVM